MHLFLYQAARHSVKKSYWNQSYRYVQNTIRGDFDLELLRRGIKGHYTIMPHGEHDFQKALKVLEMEQDFYGHVIQIEEARNAVWFKLNYDQVGKNITKYMGGWKNLDAEDLADHTQRFKELKSEMTLLNNAIQHVNGLGYGVTSFLNRPAVGETKPLSEIAVKMKEEIRLVTAELETKKTRLAHDIQEIQNSVRAYLKDHSL